MTLPTFLGYTILFLKYYHSSNHHSLYCFIVGILVLSRWFCPAVPACAYSLLVLYRYYHNMSTYVLESAVLQPILRVCFLLS